MGNVDAFWDQLKIAWLKLTLLSVIALTALQFGFSYIWQTELYESSNLAALVLSIIYASAKTLPVLALLAIASRYCNRKSRTISRLNRWVFPVYIVHQTIIILAAYALSSLQVPIFLKGGIVLILTVLSCWLVVKITHQSILLQLCLGVKPTGASQYQTLYFWQAIVTVCCIPLAVELLC